MDAARKAKNAKADADANADRAKGFQFVVEGSSEPVPIVFGRNKIGGIRVHNAVVSNYYSVPKTPVLPELVVMIPKETGSCWRLRHSDPTWLSGAWEPITTTIPPKRPCWKYNSATNTWSGPAVQSGINFLYCFPQVDSNGNDTALAPPNLPELKMEYPAAYDTSLNNAYYGDHWGWKKAYLFTQTILTQGTLNDVITADVNDQNYNSDLYNVGGGVWPNPMSFSGLMLQVHKKGGNANALMTKNDATRSDSRFSGCAYATQFFGLNREDPQFSGIPEVKYYVEGNNLSNITNGRLIRATDGMYSNNAIRVLLEYLINTTFGVSISPNDLDLVSFEEAISIAERIIQTTNISSGSFWSYKSVDRVIHLFETNLVLSSKDTHRSNINKILSCMGSCVDLIWSNGQYKIKLVCPEIYDTTKNHTFKKYSLVQIKGDIGGVVYKSLFDNETSLPSLTSSRWTKAAVALITDSDLLLDTQVTTTWPNIDNKLNYATVRFLNEDMNFMEDTAFWPDREGNATVYKAYLAQDCDILLEDDFFADGVTLKQHARALAEQKVRFSRNLLSYTFSTAGKYYFLEPGDLIEFSSETFKIGWPTPITMKITKVDGETGGKLNFTTSIFRPDLFAWNIDDHVLEDMMYETTGLMNREVRNLKFIANPINDTLNSDYSLVWNPPSDDGDDNKSEVCIDRYEIFYTKLIREKVDANTPLTFLGSSPGGSYSGDMSTSCSFKIIGLTDEYTYFVSTVTPDGRRTPMLNWAWVRGSTVVRIAAPTDLVVVEIGITGILRATWNYIGPGTITYNLSCDGAIVGTTTAKTYDFTGLTKGNHSIAIQAENINNETSEWLISERNLVTLGDLHPATVTGFHVHRDAISGKGVSLGWTANNVNDHVSHYHIKICAAKDWDFTADEFIANGITKIMPDITSTGQWTYSIKASTAEGIESVIAAEAGFYLAPVSKPYNIFMTAKTRAISSKVSLNPFDEVFFSVRLRVSSTPKFEDGLTVSVTGDTYETANLNVVDVRYYWARTVDIFGGFSEWVPSESSIGLAGITKNDPKAVLEAMIINQTDSQIVQDYLDGKKSFAEAFDKTFTDKLIGLGLSNTNGEKVGLTISWDNPDVKDSGSVVVQANKFKIQDGINQKPIFLSGPIGPEILVNGKKVQPMGIGINGDLFVNGSISALALGVQTLTVGLQLVLAGGAQISWENIDTGTVVGDITIARGSWDGGHIYYNKGNIVTYNGQTLICLIAHQSHTEQPPTSVGVLNVYWSIMGSQTGDYTSFIFATGNSPPDYTATTTAALPSLWYDVPSASWTLPVWMSKGIANGMTNIVTTWGQPVKITGPTGYGSPGTSQTAYYALGALWRSTEGFGTGVPAVPQGYYLWMKFKSSDGSWGDEFRVSGEKGERGIPGSSDLVGPYKDILTTLINDKEIATCNFYGNSYQTGAKGTTGDNMIIGESTGGVRENRMRFKEGTVTKAFIGTPLNGVYGGDIQALSTIFAKAATSGVGIAIGGFADYYNSGSVGVYGESLYGIGVRGCGQNYYDFYAVSSIITGRSWVGSNSSLNFGMTGGVRSGTYGPFTGSHDGLVLHEFEAQPGDIIVDIMTLSYTDISNTLSLVELSCNIKQKSVVGVFLTKRDLSPEMPIAGLCYPWTEDYSLTYAHVCFNAVGEGMVAVCKDGGNIEAGDYICSSARPGKGMKQDDDILHNYTVAKARTAIIWEENDDDVYLLPCTYHCG
jgi:hypothetical protein